MVRVFLFALFALVARAGFAQTSDNPPPLPDTGTMTVTVSTEAQLQSAVRNLKSNTTIVIQPGTYRLTATLYVKGPLQNVSIRGASNDRNDVVLAGPGMKVLSGDATVPFGIWTGQGVDGIKIANLTIRDLYRHAIILNPFTAKPIIYNVRLVDIGEQFIKGNPDPEGKGVNDGRLDYSVIEYTTTSRDYYTNGIDIHGGLNWQIRYNVFRNIVAPAGQLAGPAVLMWNRAGNTITDGNLFFNCGRSISYGLIDRAGSDHTGGIIRNNMIFRSASQPGDVGIMVADSPNTQVLNNTVFLSGTYPTPIEYRFAGTTGVQLINNLLSGMIGARNGATATARNNVTGATAGLFVNAAAGDLHLAPTAAAAIDTGLTVADVDYDVDGDARPAGAAYDIGADETGGTAPPPPPPSAWTFVANPASIEAGQSSVLSFTTNTSNVHNVFINGQRPDDKDCGESSCSGSLTVTPSATTTYTLTTTNSSGTPYPSMSVTVTVAAPPAATWTFTANPATIQKGQSSVLSFTTTTTNFHNVKINGQRPTTKTCGTTSCSGSLTVTPASTTTYKLTSTNDAGKAYPTLSVVVTVK
jgi:hypothetical protein